MSDFIFAQRIIGDWSVPVIELPRAERRLSRPIMGEIANSIHTNQKGKIRLIEWKKLVAFQVKESRGDGEWNPWDRFTVTLALSFCPGLHGNRPLDVENFVKPIIDALAAGLFCDADTDTDGIERWNYNDSNFSTLLIHRLPDAYQPRDEGIAVFVTSKPSERLKLRPR